MKGKQTHFFATLKDLEQIAFIVESNRNLKYVRAGLFDNPNPTVYESIIEYEELGRSKSGQVTTADNMFLVFENSSKVNVRQVPQVAGGIKYVIDMTLNPETIDFRPSGFYDKDTLIAGKIATLGIDPTALEIYNLFRKTIQKNSKQVGYARVCTDAMEFMKNGSRMVTMGIDSPSEYDLAFQN